MADWSELPGAMVVLIARRLQLIEDFVAVRQTCSSWRVATSLKDFNRSCPRLPLLMRIGMIWSWEQGVDERKFFSLSNIKTCMISLPETKIMVRCSGSKGWLIMMVGSSHDHMRLLEPITRIQIQLPILPNYCPTFSRAVLSASPWETSDYMVIIVCKTLRLSPKTSCYMGFWKPGDLTWTKVETTCWVDDMKYYNGKVYALTKYRHIMMYDILGPNPNKATKIIDLPWNYSRPLAQLVECAGRLVVVARFSTYRRILDLEMIELDVLKGTYTNITSLGNLAVFLGLHDEGFSIDASKFYGVEHNCIYSGNDGIYRTVICGREFGTQEFRYYDINRSCEILSSGVWINF